MNSDVIIGKRTLVPLRQSSCVSVCLVGIIVAPVFQTPAFAAPRAPGPPLPEMGRVLAHESFDRVFYAGVSNAVVVLPNYGTLRESWSGYSLERVGVVVPLVISGLNETGRVQVATDQGALRCWFKSYWSSATTGQGNGPGAAVTLLELVAAEKDQAVSLWTLQVSEDGSALRLLGPGKEAVLLQTEIVWRAGTWHQIILNYDSGKGTELILDGEKVAAGAGTLAVPARVARLVVGSSFEGVGAGGEVEEVSCFARPLRAAFHYLPLRDFAALGPVSEAELAYRQELRAKWQALAAAKAKAAEESGGEGGEMMRLMSGPVANCSTNSPLFITNTACFYDTNAGWTLQFDVQGTNGPADIFAIATLGTTNAWTWLERGPTCSRYEYLGMPPQQSYVILGTLQDSDNDGLTDAYEKLVSKTSPNGWTTLDRDGDGLPDAWEVAHGLDPLVVNGGADPDLDGLTNWQEYQGGTRPMVSEGFSVWVAQPGSEGNLP